MPHVLQGEVYYGSLLRFRSSYDNVQGKCGQPDKRGTRKFNGRRPKHTTQQRIMVYTIDRSDSEQFGTRYMTICHIEQAVSLMERARW